MRLNTLAGVEELFYSKLTSRPQTFQSKLHSALKFSSTAIAFVLGCKVLGWQLGQTENDTSTGVLLLQAPNAIALKKSVFHEFRGWISVKIASKTLKYHKIYVKMIHEIGRLTALFKRVKEVCDKHGAKCRQAESELPMDGFAVGKIA